MNLVPYECVISVNMGFEFGKCTVDLLLVTVLSVYKLFVLENLYGLARILQQVV